MQRESKTICTQTSWAKVDLTTKLSLPDVLKNRTNLLRRLQMQKVKNKIISDLNLTVILMKQILLHNQVKPLRKLLTSKLLLESKQEQPK